LQARRYAEACYKLREQELLTRRILMRRGVPTIRFPAYHNFVRHLNRMLAGADSRARHALVSAAVLTWVGKGLFPEVLAEVAGSLFNVHPGLEARAGPEV